jgi:ribosomal protein L40E
MAGKTKCPQCGATNSGDARRCRVCANLLNVDAPETRKGFALRPEELATEPEPPDPFAPEAEPDTGPGDGAPPPDDDRFDPDELFRNMDR